MYKGIYDRILKLAKSQKITIDSLITDCDVKNGTIHRWGINIPSADKLYRVAIRLGTTVEYLLTGENNMNEQEQKNFTVGDHSNVTAFSTNAITGNMSNAPNNLTEKENEIVQKFIKLIKSDPNAYRPEEILNRQDFFLDFNNCEKIFGQRYKLFIEILQNYAKMESSQQYELCTASFTLMKKEPLDRNIEDLLSLCQQMKNKERAKVLAYACSLIED